VLLMRDGAVTADGSHEAIATGQMGEWERSFLLAGNN
jgi:hypothetical protein